MPSFIAFGLGCWSLIVAGIARRNILGVLGFVMAATVIGCGLAARVLVK
jgi:hypothetical protein